MTAAMYQRFDAYAFLRQGGEDAAKAANAANPVADRDAQALPYDATRSSDPSAFRGPHAGNQSSEASLAGLAGLAGAGGAPNDDRAERAALVEFGAGAPRHWADCFAALDVGRPPKGVSPNRWREVLDDGGRFLDRWAVVADGLGWSALDLFGAHPTAPGARYDQMGLVWLIGGGEVIAITSDSARIKPPSGAVQTYCRKRTAESRPLWELGTEP